MGTMAPAFTYTGICAIEKLRSTLTGPVKCLPVGHSIQSPLGNYTCSVARPEILSAGAVTGLTSIWSPNRYSFLLVYAASSSGQS